MISIKKRNLFIIISLFVISFISIGICIFLYLNTPSRQLQKAFSHTFSESDFSWFHHLSTLLSEKNISQEASITVNDLYSDYLPDVLSYASGISAELSNTINPLSCYSSGKGSISYSGIPITDGIYSNTDQEILFSFPDLLSGTFRIPITVSDSCHSILNLIPSLKELWESREQYHIKSLSAQTLSDTVSNQVPDSDWRVYQILPPETKLEDLTFFCFVDSEHYVRQILLSFCFQEEYYTLEYHLEGTGADSFQDIFLLSQASCENEAPFQQFGYHSSRAEYKSKLVWNDVSNSLYHTVSLSSSEEKDYKQTYQKLSFAYQQIQNDTTFYEYVSALPAQSSDAILSGTMTYLSSFDSNTNIYEINCKQLLLKAEQIKTECTLSFHNTIHPATDDSETLHFSEPYYNLFELSGEEILSLQKELYQKIIGSLIWS